MLITFSSVNVFAYTTSYDDYDDDYYKTSSFEDDEYQSLSSSSSTYGASAKQVTTSSSKLNQMGLMIGYEDGSLGLDKTITRAEFVTLVLRLLNMEPETAANYGYSSFYDTYSHWAAQNIEIAASLGYVNGYPDGTFKPDGQITSPEIQAILIRVLNYTESLSDAAWPQNIISKSSQIGLVKNISNLTTTATRGLAAVMIDNALEIPLMEVTAYSTGLNGNYISINKDSSILNKYLGLGKLRGDVVTTSENSSRLDSNEFYVEDAKFYFADDAVDEKTIFSLKQNANYLLGRSIVAYFNYDGEIAWIDYSDNYDDENVFFSTIKKYNNNYITVTINGEDERYKITKDTSIYIDGSAGDEDDVEVGQFVKVILSGNTVSFLKVFDFDKQNIVITSISSNYISYVDRYGSEGRFNLNNYDGVNVFIGDSETSLEALQTNMVASVLVNDNDELDFYTSHNTSVSGVLSRIYGNSIYVSGKYYNLSNYMTYADYSYNKYSDDEVVVRAISSSNELQAFLDEELTVVFDLEGNARHFVFGDGYSTSKSLTNIGIVVRKWSSDEEYLRIYNPDTDSYATYAFDNNTNRNTYKTPMSYSSITSISDTSLTSNNRYIIGYNYDSSNTLTEVYLPEMTTILDVTSLYGSRYINTTEGKFYLDDETVFITDLSDEYNIVSTTFDDLNVSSELSGVQAIIVTAPYTDDYYSATNTAIYVIFVSGGDSIGTDSDNVAVVTNTYRDANSYGVELYTADGVAEYELANNISASNYEIGDLVTYRLTSESSKYAKVSYIHQANVKSATVQSTSSNRRSLTLSNGETYVVKSDAIVFDLTNCDVSDLSRNDIIKNDTSIGTISKYDNIKYVINSDEQIIAVFIVDSYNDFDDNDGEQPIAKITMSPRSNLKPTSVITWGFSESKPSNGRVITDVEWSENKQSTYTAGTHTVSLRVKDSSGLWSDWVSTTFTVTSDGVGSGITSNEEGKKPIAVITMNPNSNITTSTAITWDYRSSTCSSAVSETCTIVDAEWNNDNTYFRTPGTHTVYLRVKDSLGTWSDWTSKQVTVVSDVAATPTVTKPIAKITMSPDPTTTNVTAGTPITFTSTGSTQVGDSPIVREDFYGAVSGENTFNAGTHTVRLRVLDSRGIYSEVVSVTFTIYAQNIAPEITNVSLSPSSPKTNEDITFTVNAIDENGDQIVAYDWNNGAGTNSTYTTSYSTPGTKTVTVRVKDANNTWSEVYTKTFQVTETVVFPTVTGLSINVENPTTLDKVELTPLYNGQSNVLCLSDFGGDYEPTGYYTPGTKTVTFRFTDGEGNYSNEVRIQFVVTDAGTR